ncbi:MAG: TetR/AcrR family transcriptional regulator [Gemmatimonadaceae bacterium]
MSRAETTERLLEAAIRLGVERGGGALSFQGIATTAGVSKALLLYHFGDKTVLLLRVAARLGLCSAERLSAAVVTGDPLSAWRELVRSELASGHVALLAALGQERGTSDPPPEVVAASTAREDAAMRLAASILAAVGLQPRVPHRFIGRMLLRHLDGLAVAEAQIPFTSGELEDELDTFTIALLGFGR